MCHALSYPQGELGVSPADVASVGSRIWKVCGTTETLSYKTWPSYDEKLVVDDTITMAVQVNGKTRGTLEVSQDISKEDFLSQAKDLASVKKHMDGKNIVKEIYVPGKICNFVVK